MDRDKLTKLCLVITEAICSDRAKEEAYIEFLNKHGLKSGPTPELLASLDKKQRKELIDIFKQ